MRVLRIVVLTIVLVVFAAQARGGNQTVTDPADDAGPNAPKQLRAKPPPDARESAIITNLAPSKSGYTAVVRGVTGATGVALEEVYALQ